MQKDISSTGIGIIDVYACYYTVDLDIFACINFHLINFDVIFYCRGPVTKLNDATYSIWKYFGVVSLLNTIDKKYRQQKYPALQYSLENQRSPKINHTNLQTLHCSFIVR